MENDVLDISLNRLIVNYGKKSTDKEAYKKLYLNYFKNVPDREWTMAVENYIRNPDHKRLPTVAELSVNLPQIINQPERIACNACHKGLRSIAEKSQFGYWHSIAYACTCEAGKQHASFAVWQCSDCPAFECCELPIYQETQQMASVCKAENFHSYDINCQRWKNKLVAQSELEQAQRKKEAGGQ